MQTKIPIELLVASASAETGDVLKILGTEVTAQSEMSDDLAVSLEGGDFDASSGTLLLRLNNSNIIRISGLPTEQTIGVGPSGKQGLRGKQGINGKDGKDGKRGASGCDGRKGDRGRRGQIGPVGPTGAIGPTGSIGPTGATGATGPRGLDGQEPVYVTGTEGSYEYTIKHGRIMQWGTYRGGSIDQAIDMPFPIAFNRECTTVIVTFINAATEQASLYELTWDSEGFLLEMPTNFPIPLNDAWEFTWSAYGD